MRPTAAPGPSLSLVAVILLCLLVIPTPAAAQTDTTTTLHVNVQADGDARWTVTMRFPLEDANDTAGFERLAAEFEAGESPYLSIEPFRRAAAAAENATGRQMEVTNVDRTSTVEEGEGVGRLVLHFTWTNFATTAGDRLLVGDAFSTETGAGLSQLTADQVLEITYPDRYRPTNLVWPLINGTVRIAGPESFAPGEPSIVLEPVGPTPDTPTPTTPHTPTATPTPTTPTTPTATPIPNGPAGAFSPVIGVLFVAIVGVAGYLLWRSDRDPFGGALGTNSEEPPADPPDETATESAPEPADTETDAGAAAELLSDEERVMRLLRENDGRMKQAAIVEETDWSNAKVSQLLSRMAEDGDVDKLRIGRENLISLPEETPDEVE